MTFTRIVDGLDRVGWVLSRILLVIGSVALFALMPMMGWLVYGRYVLNATPTWVESTSLILMGVITFLVAAAVLRDEQHLSINFIRESFSPRVETLMKIASYALLAVFGVFMAVSAYELILFSWGTEIPLIHIPDGVRHIPLLVCGIGITFFSVVHILRTLLTWRDLPRERDEPPLSGTEFE